MNKKGFTLVEILAIIVILALVITLVATKGFGAFDNSKQKISDKTIAEIEEAAEVLMTEIEHCEDTDTELLSPHSTLAEANNLPEDGKNYVECEDLKEKAVSEEGIKIPISYLKEKNYISGKNAKDLAEKNSTLEYKGKFQLKDQNDLSSEIVDTTIISPNKSSFENTIINQTTTVASENKVLVDNILKNAREKKNGTELSNPKTTLVKEPSSNAEKVLATISDSDGTSYYFRGTVIDNYVEFANMCWRIVRIKGDGSIKLVLAGETSCSSVTSTSGIIDEEVIYGYTSGNLADYANNSEGKKTGEYIGLKESLDTWFNNKLTAYKSKLKYDEWCLGGNINYKYEYNGANTSWYYAAGNRIYNTQSISDLKCNNEDTINSYIGSLTSDEVIMAGGIGLDFALNKGINGRDIKFYLKDEGSEHNIMYYTLSLSDYYYSKSEVGDFVFVVNNSGLLTIEYTNKRSISADIRPVITLKYNTRISNGDGTKNNPYIIEN